MVAPVSQVAAVRGDVGGALQVWDLATGRLIQTLSGHSAEIFNVVPFEEDLSVRCFATASADGTVQVWDMVSGQSVRKLDGHGGSVYGLARLPDGHLVSGSLDGAVRVWDVSADVPLRTHRDVVAVYTVAAVPMVSRNVVAYGSFGRSVKLWDTSSSDGTDDAVTSLFGHEYAVRSVAALEGGSAVLASGSQDATIRIWGPAMV